MFKFLKKFDKQLVANDVNQEIKQPPKSKQKCQKTSKRGFVAVALVRTATEI